MRIAWTTRRSFPGPGGIASMMRVVAAALKEDITIWAARVDDQPVTRMNTTLGAQRFSTRWEQGTEIRPLPHDAFSLAAGVGLGALSIPGARRFANMPLRQLTAPPFTRALSRGFMREFTVEEPDASRRAPVFDLVHTWGGEHVNWAAGHAARGLDLPLVVTPFAHPGQWGDDPQNATFYRSANAVIALVDSEAAVYERLGVLPERIHVTGVPATPLPESDINVRKQLSLDHDPVILFLGVKEPYKGYRAILDAMPQVWSENPETQFAFVGPHTATSQRDFENIKDPRVNVTGTVTRQEVSAWLEAADILVLPSTSEIFPVAILEAWQHKTAVVAGSWWCAHDVVDDGVDGLIIDPKPARIADAVNLLLKDSTNRKAMGEAGHAKVQARFTPVAVGKRHAEIYASLLS
jgi:glycosyltransferase involved in cell wall biosynthesis